MIFTGPSFKHGHVDEERRELRRDRALRRATISASTADYRWTNEDYTPMDHAPFIGWSSSLRRRLSGRDRLQRLGHHQRHRRGDPDRRPDRGPRQSLAEAVRRDPDQAGRRRAGVRGRALPRPRRTWSAAIWRASRTSFDELAPGEGAMLKIDGQQCRRLPRRSGRGPRRLGGLHPYGLPGRLERDRPDLGLPLPRLALRARRQRHPRPGGQAAGNGDGRRSERTSRRAGRRRGSGRGRGARALPGGWCATSAKQPSLRPRRPLPREHVGLGIPGGMDDDRPRLGIAVAVVEPAHPHRAAVVARIIIAGHIGAVRARFGADLVGEALQEAGMGRDPSRGRGRRGGGVTRPLTVSSR